MRTGGEVGEFGEIAMHLACAVVARKLREFDVLHRPHREPG